MIAILAPVMLFLAAIGGREHYVLYRGLVGMGWQVLHASGLAFSMQPGCCSHCSWIWQHRLLFFDLASPVVSCALLLLPDEQCLVLVVSNLGGLCRPLSSLWTVCQLPDECNPRTECCRCFSRPLWHGESCPARAYQQEQQAPSRGRASAGAGDHLYGAQGTPGVGSPSAAAAAGAPCRRGGRKARFGSSISTSSNSSSSTHTTRSRLLIICCQASKRLAGKRPSGQELVLQEPLPSLQVQPTAQSQHQWCPARLRWQLEGTSQQWHQRLSSLLQLGLPLGGLSMSAHWPPRSCPSSCRTLLVQVRCVPVFMLSTLLHC